MEVPVRDPQERAIEMNLGSRAVIAGAVTQWLGKGNHATALNNLTPTTNSSTPLTDAPTNLRLAQPLLDGGQGKFCIKANTVVAPPDRQHTTTRPPNTGHNASTTPPPSTAPPTPSPQGKPQHLIMHNTQGHLQHRPRLPTALTGRAGATTPLQQGSLGHTEPTRSEFMQMPEGGEHPVTPSGIRFGLRPPVLPNNWPGLQPPQLDTGRPVTGSNKATHRRENKRRRREKQLQQADASYWTEYKGTWNTPETICRPKTWRNCMCPSGLALHHPAAGHLLAYATGGCPTNTGRNWTLQEMEAAIRRGPHVSAMEPPAMAQLAKEIAEKVENNQARVVLWDDIRKSPPPNLKISPVAMIPHKSRGYRAILDLSFRLRLSTGQHVPSVNESTTLTAPRGAIDQLGHTLSRIIHAFAETDPDAAIFMAKFDIKDGFWRLDCAAGEEWNFAYVMPQAPEEPVKLVVPNSLQMGWVESPAYFCVASETARDVAAWHAERPIGELPAHKFLHKAMEGEDVQQLALPPTCTPFRYFLDVYVDDFIQLAIPTSRQQLEHITNAVLTGIHEIFPAHPQPEHDPISYKKLLKGEGTWRLNKDLLGFTFNGAPGEQTMQLEAPKQEFLLAILHKWLRASRRARMGIPFAEFESVTQKIRHAFMAIPSGRGLLTPCNSVISVRPPAVFLHHNKSLRQTLEDCRTLLREASISPTPCRELVMGAPGFVGIKDASLHGVGGIIVGHRKACRPTVFRLEWPPDIKQAVRQTNSRRGGYLTNSDLEMAGLLFLWLVMEDVCDITPGTHIALFSDNSPTVSWVRRLASRGSRVAGHLIRALALRLKVRQVSPLTPSTSQERPTHLQTSHHGHSEVNRGGTAQQMRHFLQCLITCFPFLRRTRGQTTTYLQTFVHA
jgi:hypothetical protein